MAKQHTEVQIYTRAISCSVNAPSNYPEYNVYNESYQNNSDNTDVTMEHVDSLNVQIPEEYKNDKHCFIKKIELYIGDLLWKTITFKTLFEVHEQWVSQNLSYERNELIIAKDSASMRDLFYPSFWVGDDYSFPYLKGITTINIKEGSTVFEITDTYDNQPMFAYYHIKVQAFVETNSIRISEAGTKNVTARITYHRDDTFNIYQQTPAVNSYDYVTTLYKLVYKVKIYSPVLSNIELDISNVQRNFYKNQVFSYSGLVVTGYWKYVVGGKSAYTNTVTGYEVDVDEVDISEVEEFTLTEAGTPQVDIWYGGKYKSYLIYVYEVSSINKPTFKSIRDDKHFRVNETYATLGKARLNYSDGTYEDVNVNVSEFDTSYNNEGYDSSGLLRYCGVSATSTKTGETFSWLEDYYVHPLVSISVDSSNAQTSFDYGETFSSAGLSVSAYFGDAGSESVASSSVVGALPNVIGTHSLSVSYAYGGITKTSSYVCYRNGLKNILVDISNANLVDSIDNSKLRIPKGGIFSTTGIKVYYKTFNDGVESGWNELTALIDTLALSNSSVDTSTAEDKTVTFSITDLTTNQVITSGEVPVVVYGHTSLTVNNFPEGNYYVSSAASLPTLNATYFPSLANVTVVADTSDGRTEELTFAAVNNGYTIDKLDQQLSLGENTITITDSTDETVTTTKTISVVVDTPDVVSSSDIVVIDNRTAIQKYAEVGVTVSLENIVVKIKMTSGEYRETNNYIAVINGKEGLVFDSEDTVGDDYELDFSYNNVTSDDHPKVTLNGITSISNISLNKTVFEVGESFSIYDSNSNENGVVVSYTATFANGDVINELTNNVTTSRLTNFEYSEAGTDNEAGTVSIPLTIMGKSKSANVYVKKAVSLEFSVPNNTNSVYQYGSELNLAENNIIIRKNYNNGDSQDVNESQCSYIFTKDTDGNVISECSKSFLVPESTRTSSVVYVKAQLIVYGDVTISTSSLLNINVLAIKTAYIASKDTNDSTHYSKFYFENGNNFNLSNYQLLVQLNNSQYLPAIDLGTTDNLAIIPEIGTKILSTDEINGSIVYSYGNGDSITVSFAVYNHYLDDISTNIDSIITGNMYVGDSLDLSSLEVEKTINSTDSEEQGYPATSDITQSVALKINGQNIGIDDYTFMSAGSYALTISYGGITKTKNITVVAVVLSSITLVTNSSFKSLSDYYDEQYLTLNGLSITRTYNNGSSVSGLSFTNSAVKLLDENGNELRKTLQLNNTEHDNMELFISYNENGSMLNPVSLGTLSVTAKDLTSIEILNTSPHKTSFAYGDKFNINGMIIKATFNNGSTSFINILDSNLSVSGDVALNHVFNPTDDLIADIGDWIVTISYTYGSTTRTTTYTASFVAPTLDHIYSNANSDVVRKQFKDGDSYSNTGLEVIAVFANGWEYLLQSFTTNASTVLGFSGYGDTTIRCTGNYGLKTITISGSNPFGTGSATTSYVVDITSSGAIISAVLQLDSSADYNHYLVGERYTAKGVSFFVTDVDGNQFSTGVFATSVVVGSILRRAQRLTVNVTYTNGSFSKTESYDIIVSVENVLSLTETNNCRIAIGKSDGDLIQSVTHEETTITFGKVYDEKGKITGEYYPIFNEDKISVDDNQLHAKTYKYNVYTGNNLAEDCIGYMDMGLTAEDGTVVRNAHIVLFNDPVNPIDGSGNIEVKFPHYVSGYADRINKARFGIVYNNRLFVSGNPDYPNCDWHSGAVNTAQVENYDKDSTHDYTYFSDLDYCYYGNKDTPVVGYDIYRDGDLIVFKKDSQNQATLYRRQLKLVTAMNASGETISYDESLAEESFPKFDINSMGGIGALSNRSIKNFFGETIFLSKQGIKALTSKEDIYNNAKYTYEVSSYINEKIQKEELENAILFAYENVLILKTSRGVYVGYYELRNEENEYEWYFLSNINADIFFEYQDELYFANDNGNIYKFAKSLREYKDKARDFINVGGATLNITPNESKIIVGSSYAGIIKEGRPFHLLTSYNVGGADRKTQIHASLGYFTEINHKNNTLINGGSFDVTAYNGLINATNNTIEIKTFKSNNTLDEEKLLSIEELYYDGREVYFDKIVGNNYQINTYQRYFLKKYNNDINSRVYQVIDENNNVISLAEIDTLRMSFIVNDLAVTYITDVTDYGSSGAKQFSLIGDHNKILSLIKYCDVNGYYSGTVTSENNVEAYYVTAPYSMGSIALTKTIWQWIIANDTELASYMDIGYLSSRKQGDYEMVIKSSGGAKQLNFDGLNFDKIHFTSDKLPHIYSKNRIVANVSFIRFLFRNFEDSNIVLTTLEVIYTVSQLVKGVK